MSNVTSQSELTTKEIVEQAISDYHNAILPYLAKGNNGYSETPIGAMQMFDDDTAPSGWLVADGTGTGGDGDGDEPEPQAGAAQVPAPSGRDLPAGIYCFIGYRNNHPKHKESRLSIVERKPESGEIVIIFRT